MDYPPDSPPAPCIAATTNRTTTSSRSWRNPLNLNRVVMHHEENVRVEKEERVSLMFSALPASIQSRLPPIPSLRRTMTTPIRSSIMPLGFSTAVGSGTAAGNGNGLGLRSRASSPPLSEADTEIEHEHDDVLEELEFGATRSYVSVMGLRTPGREAVEEGESTVDWRYAKLGVELVINSGREYRRPQRDSSSKFERSAYITGVGYLLEGLPRDLDDNEVMLLQRSLPAPLAELLDFRSDGAAGVANRGCRGQQQQHRRPPAQRNLVHVVVLNVLMWAQAWICWLLPHVLFLMGETMRLEREYNVTQTLLGIATMWFNAIRSMSDGMAGQFVGDVFQYTTKGVEDALKDFADPEMRDRRRDNGQRGYARRR